MKSPREIMDDAESYNSLLSETRTLTPGQVLRVRELIHLLKAGRRITSHAPTCNAPWCDCGLQK